MAYPAKQQKSIETTGHSEAAVNQWIERFNTRPVAILPRTVNRITALKDQKSSNVARFCEILMTDPALCLHILREANTLLHKKNRPSVTTLGHACLMLGLPRIFALTEATSTLADLAESPTKTGILRSFSRSIHAVVQIRDWTGVLKHLPAEELELAALMQEFVLLSIWAACPDTAQKIEQMNQLLTPQRQHKQKEVLGITLKGLSIAVAQNWHLPPLLYQSLDSDEPVNDQLLSVDLAHHIAAAADSGWYCETTTTYIQSTANLLGLDLEETVHRTHRNAVEAARESSIYGVLPAAALLPRLAEEKPAPAVPDTPEKPAPLLSFEDYLSRFQAVYTGQVAPHEAVSLCLRGLNRGIGLERVLFATLTKDRKRLRARFSIAMENDEVLRGLDLPMDKPHLFRRIMKKPQNVWVNDGNRISYAPSLPAMLHRQLANQDFFALSLFIGDKPVGLIYADDRNRELSETSYDRFKQLCLELGKSLNFLQGKN